MAFAGDAEPEHPLPLATKLRITLRVFQVDDVRADDLIESRSLI
jgi:hypothetical protein